MEYKPVPHQSAGINWLLERPYAALWTTMGGGKTSSTATAFDKLLDHVEVSRVLVVGPPRVAAKVWQLELQKWSHLRHLKTKHITSEDLPVIRTTAKRAGKEVNVMKLVNTRDTKRRLEKDEAIVFTIHYDLVPRLVKLFGDDWIWDCVILDESSMVSNQDTARFKALRRIRGKVSRFYELTGTPMSNGFEKLYSQIYLLDGGKRLGRTLTEFRENFMMPDKRNGDRIFSYKPKPGARERIYDLLKDICLSVDSGIVTPGVQMNTIPIYLDEGTLATYRELEREYITGLTDNGVIEAVNGAALGGKLLQLANGVVYDADKVAHEIHSLKLDALEDLAEATEGPLMVVYWYQHDLERIKARFPKAVVVNECEDFEEQWNTGKIRMALAQPRSSGHGNNYQFGGNAMVWYGPTYDLELYLQMNKRLDRPGQENVVTIHHLVAQGTIDEEVMAVLPLKEFEQDALLEAVKRRVEKASQI